MATAITLSQGVPIEAVSEILGHTDIKTAQIYAKPPIPLTANHKLKWISL